jgi:hypothetical protein
MEKEMLNLKINIRSNLSRNENIQQRYNGCRKMFYGLSPINDRKVVKVPFKLVARHGINEFTTKTIFKKGC